MGMKIGYLCWPFIIAYDYIDTIIDWLTTLKWKFKFEMYLSSDDLSHKNIWFATDLVVRIYVYLVSKSMNCPGIWWISLFIYQIWMLIDKDTSRLGFVAWSCYMNIPQLIFSQSCRVPDIPMTDCLAASALSPWYCCIWKHSYCI